MRIEYVDNGCPPYDPQKERWIREWIDEERSEINPEGFTVSFVARVAKYTIQLLTEAEMVASIEERVEAIELIVNGQLGET